MSTKLQLIGFLGTLTQVSSPQIQFILFFQEILNKCIEEVENFVVMLKRINEARKQLQAKRKSSKKKKVESKFLVFISFCNYLKPKN